MRVHVPWLIAALVLGLAVWALWPVDGAPAGAAHAADVLATAPDGTLRAASGPSLAGRVQPRSEAPAGEAAQDAEPATAEPRIVEPNGLPLRVHVVDAETGRTLETPWALRHGEGTKQDDARIAPRGAFGVERVRPTALRPRMEGTVGVEIQRESLVRHVVWDETMWTAEISTYATALEAFAPLRVEARVYVHATDHEGEPVHQFTVQGFRVAGRHVSENVSCRPARHGRRLMDVPHFRGRPLEVLAVRTRDAPGDEPCMEVECDEFIEDFGASDEMYLEETFPGFYEDAALGTARMHGSPYAPIVVKVRFTNDSEDGILWGSAGSRFFRGRSGSRRVTTKTGSVELEVLRRDGRPAVGARLLLRGETRRVGADGFVRFRKIGVGSHTVSLREPGLVATSLKVEIGDGETTRATLRESEGGTLVVRVQTPEGDPAPYATVALSKFAHWADLQDGVQRLDPFTDANGERELVAVPSGERTITVTWGGLTTRTSVDVRDGARQFVTVKLAEPEGE